MPQRKKLVSDQDPRSLLALAGLQETQPRVAILELLKKADAPLSANDIRRSLRSLHLGISTVQKMLHLFVEIGWIHPLLLEGAEGPRVAYRIQEPGEQRVYCQLCGGSTHVEAPSMIQMLREIESASGFRVQPHQLSLTGLCPECQKKGTDRKNSSTREAVSPQKADSLAPSGSSQRQKRSKPIKAELTPFGEFLRVFRQKQRLRLDEFSRLIGFASSELLDLERGKRPPGRKNLERIRYVFELDEPTWKALEQAAIQSGLKR
jgi:Fe2+ or Zn2+ uptake regulation protein